MEFSVEVLLSPPICRMRRRARVPRCRRAAASTALVALLALGCGSDSAAVRQPAAVSAGASPTPIVVSRLDRRTFSDRIEAIGTARARESLVITAEVTERLTRIHFADGQSVKQGFVLAELTSSEESAQLAEAQANYEEAVRQYRRSADLFQRGSASRSNLDKRTAGRDAAAARLEELQARLADRLIRAPFDGVLGLRAVSPGTLLKPGDEITTLDDIDTIKLDFSIPEAYLGAVRADLRIDARAAAYPDTQFAGVVDAIDTRIDPRTRAVRIRAIVPNPHHRLRPGMLLSVALEAHPEVALALPEQALVPRGEVQYVFVLDGDGLPRRMKVTIGRRRPGFVELLTGLTGDETVIVDGAHLVRPGSAVRIVRASDDIDPGA